MILAERVATGYWASIAYDLTEFRRAIEIALSGGRTPRDPEYASLPSSPAGLAVEVYWDIDNNMVLNGHRVAWGPSGWLTAPVKSDGGSRSELRDGYALLLSLVRSACAARGLRINLGGSRYRRYATRRRMWWDTIYDFASQKVAGRNPIHNPTTTMTREADQEAMRLRRKWGSWRKVKELAASRIKLHG